MIYFLKYVILLSILRLIRKRCFFEMVLEIVNFLRKEVKLFFVILNLMNIKVLWNNIYMYVIVIFV